MKCLKCGVENIEGNKYCIACGSKLEKNQSVEQINYKVCSKCGFQNSLTDNYCVNCGEKLENWELNNFTNQHIENSNKKQRQLALILGIIAIIISFFGMGFPFIGQIAAFALAVCSIVLSIVSLLKGFNKESVIGIILSVIAIFIAILMFMLYIYILSLPIEVLEKIANGEVNIDGEYFSILLNKK